MLLDQWNMLKSELERKKAAYLGGVLVQHPKPDVIYSLESYNTIRALRVDKADVYVRTPYVERKPTKKDVAALREAVDGFSPSHDDVFLCWSYDTTSGAVKLSEFLSSGNYAITQEVLLPKQQELIEKYAPREGYKPCTYCSTQRQEKHLKRGTVFAAQYPHGRKESLYCFDKPCAGYDQMAHEG